MRRGGRQRRTENPGPCPAPPPEWQNAQFCLLFRSSGNPIFQPQTVSGALPLVSSEEYADRLAVGNHREPQNSRSSSFPPQADCILICFFLRTHFQLCSCALERCNALWVDSNKFWITLAVSLQRPSCQRLVFPNPLNWRCPGLLQTSALSVFLF